VHATLALAAATALDSDSREWLEVAGDQLEPRLVLETGSPARA
jgi:hypothetical protein